MSKRPIDRGSGPLIKFMVIISFGALFFAAATLSYSQTGYTLVKHPGMEGKATICIEGEIDPTNQTITVMHEGDDHTQAPWISVNGQTHLINASISDNVSIAIDDLRVGCNDVSYGAGSDNHFKVRLGYKSHYRPTIKFLEIGNMKVGHNVRYFLATADWEDKPVVMGRLNITDVTRSLERRVFYRQFNGSATRFRMEEPGNYRGTLQVFDGVVWSDVYEASFQSHVITTDEQVTATVTRKLADDEPVEYDGYIPAYISPDLHPAKVSVKRTANGAYILTKSIWESASWLVSDMKARYIDGT